MSTLLETVGNSIKNWWWFLVKGLLLIATGIAIFARPVAGYVGLSILLTIVIILSGITQVVFATSNKALLKGWGWTLVSGILDIGIGIYLAMYPLLTMATLPFFVGFWLIFKSFYLMGASFDLNDLGIPGWGWLLLGGFIVLLAGFYVIYYPVAGAAGIVAVSGTAFILAGILYIILSFKLKDIKVTAKSLLPQ
jgi:uncharacterized membrane protein HdeD (DUF308 family)